MLKSIIFLAVKPLIGGFIVFAGIVVVHFAITGQWPPEEMLIGATIGGMLSPFFWRIWGPGRAAAETDTESRISE